MSSSTIGSLNIDVLANIAGMVSDMGKAQAANEKAARDFRDQWSSAIADVKSTFDGALKVIGVGIGAGAIVAELRSITKEAIDLGDSFNKLSQKSGIGVETLSGIAYAGDLADVSLEALTGGVAKFARSSAEAAAGSKLQAAAFEAMHISVKGADGAIRPMDALLGDVAERFAGYRDGVEKTALAQVLFGKSGAEMIPLLNAGRNGLADAAEEARALGFEFSDIASDSEEFNDNLTRMQKAATGLGADLARELLPMLIEGEERFLDFIKAARESGELQSIMSGVAEGVSAVVSVVKDLAVEFSSLAKDETLLTFLSNTRKELEGIMALAPKIRAGEGLSVSWKRPDWLKPQPGDLAFDLSARDAVRNGQAAADANPWANLQATAPALRGLLDGLAESFGLSGQAADDFGLHVQQSGEEAKQAAPNVKALADAEAEAAKQATKVAADGVQAQEFLDKLAGKVGGPYQKAWAEYGAAIEQASRMYDKFVKDGMSAADAQAFVDEATRQATQNLQVQIDTTTALDRVIASASSELDRHREALGKTADQQAVNEQYTRLLGAAEKDLLTVMGPLTEADQKRLESLRSIAAQIVRTDKAVDEFTAQIRENEAASREWTEMFVRAGDQISNDFARDLVEGGDVMASLADVARQTVESILAYFAKLAVINPLLNSIFGGSMVAGGGSLLPTMANAVFGGGSTGGVAGSMLNFTSTAGGATQNSILNSGSWLNAGKNLWNGFSTGLSNFWNGSGSGIANIAGGRVNLPAMQGSPYGGSALGQGIGIAGGIYAGYNRFQNRYDTTSGLAGGAAYGLGTYAVGAGLASAAAGTGFAAGMSGAFAIPVVGWVAAAAMLIDMISGGSLFGTGANKFQRGESDLIIGPDGGSVTIGADYKGKKPLFGGSYHKWRTIDPTDEQKDAATGFYKALLDDSTTFAKRFGAEVGQVASGTFRSEFDKKGNVTGTTAFINGKEYKGEDQEAFAQRLRAESYILNLKAVGADVTAYTAKFIADAEAYAQAVEDSANAIGFARQDIKDGIDVGGGKGLQGAFDTTLKYMDGSDSVTQTYQRLSAEAADLKNDILLLTGQDSIESIEAFLREAQRFGESLGQTYARLQEASQNYNQFVAQFKPQATYVDDFEAGLSNVNDQMLAYIKQANEYAKAAGLQGASTEDLINIQKWAVEQQNALLAQLEATAQAGAFDLGLTTVGTLDQVNAEIARLQGQAGRGATAVQSFGSAMRDAARAATDAINLLLGDLSPLNDQQKLQTAMQGLRAGTVSQEQVLEIGRRLYASSQAYNDLFAQVQQYSRNGTTGGGVTTGGGSTSTGNGLSPADQRRLADLLKQRDEMQTAAQLAKYQTLAQQIAEIAMVKGQDWKEVLASMKIDIAAFEKGLGLNDEQTGAMIARIMDSKDSNKQNSESIVRAIKELGDRLLRQSSTEDTDYRSPGGRGSHVGTMTAEDADLLGASIVRHLDRRPAMFPTGNRRNERAYSP